MTSRRWAVALGVVVLAAAVSVAAFAFLGEDEPEKPSIDFIPQVDPPLPPPPEAADPPEPDDKPAGTLATGITERNASLLFAGGARTVDPGLEASRARVSALRPAYYRLAVDWAQLQPSPGRPAALAKPDDGCLRGIAPCGAFAGIRDQLRAVASQQRAAGGGGEAAPPGGEAARSGDEAAGGGGEAAPPGGEAARSGDEAAGGGGEAAPPGGEAAPRGRDAAPSAGGWEVVVTIYGVPAWAARRAGGCERPEAEARSRPISDTGLRGYRRLVRDLDALARAEGVALRWWAPWNEPNQPYFVSPQRAACATSSAPLAPAVYARLVRAAREELRALGGDRRLVLGELAGFDGPRPFGAGIAEFVRALPDDVACAGDVWSQHAYAERGAAERAGPVGQLERALDRRACTRGKPIWVTETGAGGARSGTQRDTSARALRRGCRYLDALLRRWHRDPRVDAAFQYTYREDTAFPVGLADARLRRTYPTYDLWRAWGGDRAPDGPAPRGACATP